MAQSSDATPLLRIGSRGSPLALAQAEQVRGRLCAAQGCAPEAFPIVVIRTTGDTIQDRSLADSGGKGLFTKEIEEALVAGKIDLAVHSAKDVPTLLPPGLALAACLPREDPRDVFISPRATSLADLPRGAKVGTASVRRQAQVLRLRPDLEVVTFRGNVGTRLAKLESGSVDATLLALAGLKRLGLTDAATTILSVDEFLPAAGQGIIALECREDDDRILDLWARFAVAAEMAALLCERAFLGALDGSCRSPIAGHAVVDEGQVRFRGLVLRPDGSEAMEATQEGSASDAARLGSRAGQEIWDKVGPAFFKGTSA